MAGPEGADQDGHGSRAQADGGPGGAGSRRRLARLAGLTRPAAQANVPGPWWRLGYTPRFWVLLVPVSLLAGMAGAGLKLLLRLVEHAAWDYHAGEQANAVGQTSAAHRIVSLAIAGVLAGLIWWAMRGMGFVWLLGAVNLKRIKDSRILVAPLVAFLILGLVSIAYPQLLGNGRDIGENVFLGGLAPATLGALLILKPLVTAMCWGSGARGGMFTPTTSYGALLGRGWSLL